MSASKLKELIKDVKIAMFTTVDQEGMLRSRPLATLEDDAEPEGDLAELWFFTAIDAPKVDEISAEHRVNLAYSEPTHQRFISVSGMATTSRDRERIRHFWKPIHKAWFPDGVDDPKLALIHVRVDQAEYWDAPSSGIVNAFGMAKAIITGERYEPGENDKIRLRA